MGQEHVVRTLSNAIERDRVHHAYLFVGSRGTGKTSMAKILARSLNCVDGPTLTPCGVCESCRSIASGSSMDVIEMDAASNRSVDDIRELRERVGYAPAASRWKVYILDEAHMLTREAWNAFLKTLEEPPPNTVFVLATTEAHKVMPTIVDRCQRFDFARPSPEDIAIVISRVAASEGFTLGEGAVAAIARAANGSFRDALGTLDQLVAYSGNEIATDDVLAVLGVADAELLFAAAESISTGDGRGALEVISALARSGRDPARFATDLVAHLRQLIVIGTLGEIPDHFMVVAEHEGRLSEQARSLGAVALVRAIDILSEATASIREGDEARMTLELALLRAARPEIDPSRAALVQRLERLERSPGEGTAQPAAAAPHPVAVPPPPPSAPAGARPPAPEPSEEASQPDPPSNVAALAEGAVATAEHERAQAAPAAEAAPEVVDLDRIAALWPAALDHMRQSGAGLLAAAIGAARPISYDAETSVVEVGFPPSAAFNRRKAEVKENRDRLVEALRTVVGVPLTPSYETLDAEPAEPEPDPAAPSVDLGGEAALLERFVSEFDAEVLIDGEPKEETS